MAERHLNSISTGGNKYNVNDVPELVDIRLGADGTEYVSAGDAVRGQIGQIEGTLITDIASGSIASFSDGSDGLNLRDLKVNVEPSQDLHGYSNPWPGGGNSNLLPELSTQTKNGLTFTADRGQYTVSGTPSATTDFDVTVSIPAGTYTFAAFNPATSNYAYLILITQSGTGNPSAQLTAANRTYTFTTTETSVKFRIRFYTGQTFSNFRISPMLVSGSTAPTSFSPYSNICPITGWENVKVTRTGVNVWDGTSEAGYIDTNTGAELPNASQSRSFYIRVLPSTQYKFVNENAFTGVRIAFYDKYKNFVSGLENSNANPQTFTTPSTAWYLRFYWGDISKVSINYPATYTSYIAPSTASITISLGSTVYGGSLDVTTGVLTVDRIAITKTLSQRANQSSLTNCIRYNFANFAPSTIKGGGAVAKTICTMLPYAYNTADSPHFYTTSSNTAHLFVPSSVPASQSFTVIAELATPTTVQLTPQQMATLLGQNNIFADAGDVDVTYVADTKKYIAKMIANALNA